MVISDMPRINLGGGDKPLSGFVTIDRKEGHDILTWLESQADNSVAEFYASHVIEHFGHIDCNKVLANMFRVLAPGGRLRVAVPDFDVLCKLHVEGKTNILPFVYGGQTNGDDYHKTGFNFNGLRSAMRNLGFVALGRWQSELEDCASMVVSANVEGYKPRLPLNEILKPGKAVAVMSVGRLLFADAVRCMNKVVHKLGIPVIDLTGAFWRQTMETVIDDALRQNPNLEWIITLDHDSVFTMEQFERMAVLFDNHPEIDALAPIQPHRNFESVLAWTDGKTIDTMAEVAQVSTAHFGLTFIRAAKLREFAHPWFYGKPDAEGKWGSGRVDDDIAFWRKWNEAGNNVYITPRVGIGHLENVVLWAGTDYKPVAQPCCDFIAEGLPPEDALH